MCDSLCVFVDSVQRRNTCLQLVFAICSEHDIYNRVWRILLPSIDRKVQVYCQIMWMKSRILTISSFQSICRRLCLRSGMENEWGFLHIIIIVVITVTWSIKFQDFNKPNKCFHIGVWISGVVLTQRIINTSAEYLHTSKPCTSLCII